MLYLWITAVTKVSKNYSQAVFTQLIAHLHRHDPIDPDRLPTKGTFSLFTEPPHNTRPIKQMATLRHHASPTMRLA